ncbi:MAG: hypothetical protein WBQ45_20350 [Roseiarcus sp.]
MGEIELLKEFKQKWTKREIRKDTSQNIENNSDAPRGTRLLELLERILPKISEFNDIDDIRCATVIDLLSAYCETVKSRIKINDPIARVEFINTLIDLYDKSRFTDVGTACGVFIVASHVESTYLGDQDAKLVYSLTGLHIHRAKSITCTKHLHLGDARARPGIPSRVVEIGKRCARIFGAHIQEPSLPPARRLVVTPQAREGAGII